MGELVTEIEAARILGVQRQTLAIWRLHRENLPFIKVGRLVRYRLSDIESWVSSRTVAVGRG
jgi:excisionase family DNA binding protein